MIKQKEQQNVKQDLLDALEGKFKVTEVIKDWDKRGELCLEIHFSFRGREGKVDYYPLSSEDSWLNLEFVEKDDEDIYGELNDWIDEHLGVRVIVKVDDKEIK